VSLTNSTIAGNTAGGVGGGIVFDNGNGNFTPETLLIRNSIIAGNLDNGTAPDFLAPTVTLAVFNSNTTGTTLTAGNNNRLNVDFATVLETEVVDGVTVPLLTDNGGGVETIALLANSPAIDAGSNAFRGDLSGTTDQRGSGFDRFIDGDNDGTETVDIGAFEFDFDFASTFLLASVTQASSSALEPSSANLSDAQPEVFDELELLDFELDEVFDGLSLT